MTEEKKLVSVVFTFDHNARTFAAHEKRYTYYYVGPEIKQNDIAVVLSPLTNALACVLVVSLDPQSEAIGRATKPILGIVDFSPAASFENIAKVRAIADAWKRVTGD